MLKNYFLLKNLLEKISKAVAKQRVLDVYTQQKNEVVVELERSCLCIYFHNQQPFLTYKTEAHRKNQSMSILKSIHGHEILALELLNNQRIIQIELNDRRIYLNLYHGQMGLSVYNGSELLESVKSPVEPAIKEPENTAQHINAFLHNEAAAQGIEPDKLVQNFKEANTLYWYSLNGQDHFTLTPFTSLAEYELIDRKQNLLEAHANFCYRYIGILANSSLKHALEQKLAKQVRYLDKTIRTLTEALVDEASQQKYEQYGHLILSNLHQIKRYDEQVILDNWFVEPAAKVTIALKSNLSPQENAERFYRKAKAVQSNRKEMNVRLEHARKKRAICAELEEKLAPAFRGKALEKVKLAMIAQGWYTAETAKEKRQMDPKTTYTTEFLIDDYEVLVGKDAKSNDYLSLKMAKANDIWFHVQGSPGSHVVLRWHGNKDNPPKDLVQKVASLTAFYSKQKNAGTIPVIYTQAKYVRKPRGAKAGAVTVQNEKSVFVKPKAYEDLV